MSSMAKNTQTAAPAQATPNFLSTLRVSNEKRNAAANQADPVARARANALSGIAEQIRHLEAALAGTEYMPTRTKYVDGADGKRVKVDAPKRRLLWYWKSGDVWYTECRYGTSQLSFGDGGSALQCGSKLEDVIATLETVRNAVNQGELDAELMRLAARRTRR
jgi:hypothetical protein